MKRQNQMRLRYVAVLIVCCVAGFARAQDAPPAAETPAAAAPPETKTTAATTPSTSAEKTGEDVDWMTSLMSSVGSWLPELITGLVGLVGIAIQELLKRRNEEYLRRGLHEPIPIGANEKRNSIILVGLGGTGKTTLIRSLLKDNTANPDERTEHYELYHGTSAAKGDKYTYRFFISDYKGQDIATLISSFIVQQLQLYSPMSYGHIQSIILMVDLVPPKKQKDDPDPVPIQTPNKKRIQTHLDQWSDLALDAIKGLVTDESLRYVCLFINKIDLIHERTPEADRSNVELYAELRQRLVDRFGQRVHVVLGSTRKGDGLVELENKLRLFSTVN
jgi:GTPase SAR1 family protein